MVQAILEGRKTMTRRTKGLECVNDEPDFYTWCNEVNQMDIPHKAIRYDKNYYYEFTGKYNNSTSVVTTCPYGKVGDILWVRETWRKNETPTGWPYHFYADDDVINGKSVEIKMHRQIMNVLFNNKIIIDHKDRNGLNNQRENLRRCSRSQNNINSTKRKKSTSIYKGVSYEASGRSLKKWVAQVYFNKKQYWIGRFNTESEAAKAYDKKAFELHGEFAVMNFDKTSLKQQS